MFDGPTLNALADAIASRMLVQGPTKEQSRWRSAEEAAEYLRCPISRVRKLTMTGDLPAHRDGRRVLYDVAELDNFVLKGGAKSP